MALTDGVIGCWSPGVRGSGYLLPDVSPRSNHMRLQNTDAGTDWLATSISGVSGRVLDFDGVNDQAVSDYNLPAATNRTVAAWVFVRVLQNQWIFGTNFGAFSSGLFVGLQSNGFLRIALTVTQFGDSVSDPDAFPANQWQHVCATHRDNNYRLFRNGVLLNSGTMATTPVAAVGYLGSYGNGGYWNGQIGESVFFERAVSDAEVMEMYRRGNGAIGRILTGQTRRPVYGNGARFKAAWARRQSQIIGGGL